MEKEFLTYNQQMRYLRDIKGISCSGSADKKILSRVGYFNLVNGYKMPFTSGKAGNNHIYIGGTTIKQMYQLKNFDDDLRYHLLRYITKVEEEIRNLVGYKFDMLNNEGKIPWYNVEAYDPNLDTQSVIKVISDSYQQIQKSHQNYIKHYIEIHKYIPTWILIKAIKFSTFIDFLEYSKRDVKYGICELYGIKSKDGSNNIKLLIGSLNWMRKVRNSCAHNERIYGMKRDNGRIYAPHFDCLPNSYKRERRQMIMDIIVYMRYYLSDSDYKKFVNEIKLLLLNLKSNINISAFDKVRADMGIKNIDHLDDLLKIKKNIEYNKF